MRVLFFCVVPNGGMYQSLAEEFVRNGHEVQFYSPSSVESSVDGSMPGIRKLFFKTGALTEVGMLKKAISTISFSHNALRCFKKNINPKEYDLILLSTPTISYYETIKYAKKVNPKIKFYLILRDIYPEAFKVSNLAKIPFMYDYFKRLAQKTYDIADIIGCMSPHSVSLVLENYCQGNKTKVVLLENWGERESYKKPDITIRSKYGLEGKFIVMYGGNLGAPQNLGHILNLAKTQTEKKDLLFLFIGSGTQSELLKKRVKDEGISNVSIWDSMPRMEYEQLLKTADLGLISLRTRAHFANIPSKTVSYMANKIPILASIDKIGDYRSFIIDRIKCGLWSFDDDLKTLSENLDRLYNDSLLRKEMGENGRVYFEKYLTVDITYKQILEQLGI